jgi:hypothetical protein
MTRTGGTHYHTKENTMSAKESKVTDAQREANGAPNLTPAGGSNASSIDPANPANGGHIEPGDATGAK